MKIISVKDKINQVSPSFCLAKWLQVSLDLHHGTNHSCHHPARHKISLEEIRKNPSALHNTSFKKGCRKMMLEGERPPECSYCWNMEDSSPHNLSDRFYKSSSDWAFPYLGEISKTPWSQDVNPTYVEVLFGHDCQLSCLYCNADVSSSIAAEMEKWGPYPTSTEGVRGGDGFKKYEGPGPNPYIEAFWKWWPELSPGLKVFRITGGEPLLSRNTFQVLRSVLATPLPHLILAINSNLGISEHHFSHFTTLVKELTGGNKVKKFQLFTSVDSHGHQAEYIRAGLDYGRFMARAEFFLEQVEKAEMIFMVTYGLLSLPRFPLLLQEILVLKKKYPSRVVLEISLLVVPSYLSLKIMDPSLVHFLKTGLTFMEKNPERGNGGFSPPEIEKLHRILRWVERTGEREKEEEQIKLRTDFFLYIREFDRRKGRNFQLDFPELADFYRAAGDFFDKKKRDMGQGRPWEDLPALLHCLSLEELRDLLEKGPLSESMNFALVARLIRIREEQTPVLWRLLQERALEKEPDVRDFLSRELMILEIVRRIREAGREGEFAEDFETIRQFSLYSMALWRRGFLNSFSRSAPPVAAETLPPSLEEKVERLFLEYRLAPHQYLQLSQLLKIHGDSRSPTPVGTINSPPTTPKYLSLQ